MHPQFHRIDSYSGFNIDFDQQGTYYVSALVKKNSAAGGGNNFATVALGGFAENAEFEMTLGSGGTFTIGAKNSSSPNNITDLYEAGETYFLIGKVTTSPTALGNDQFALAVYGGTAVDNFADTVGNQPLVWHDTYDANITGTASSLNLRAGANSLVEIDEIRLGTTWGSVVPEPSSALLLLLSLAGLTAVRTRSRRRR